MNIKHPKNLITVAAGLALILTVMAASVPAQTIDTRLGKLNFENGFPSEETARKLFDEMDYQRAVQAYLWAYPAVSFESIRIATNRDLGVDLNDLIIADNYADPKGIWLTANDTTIYALANVDLGKSGAIVVDIPPGAIVGIIDDFWQRSIADVGLPGPDGAKGGKFLLQRHDPRHRSKRRQGCRRPERQAGKGLSAERKQQSQAEQIHFHVGKGHRYDSAQGDGVLGASFGVHQQQPRPGARPVLHGHAQAAGHREGQGIQAHQTPVAEGIGIGAETRFTGKINKVTLEVASVK